MELLKRIARALRGQSSKRTAMFNSQTQDLWWCHSSGTEDFPCEPVHFEFKPFELSDTHLDYAIAILHQFYGFDPHTWDDHDSPCAAAYKEMFERGWVRIFVNKPLKEIMYEGPLRPYDKLALYLKWDAIENGYRVISDSGRELPLD